MTKREKRIEIIKDVLERIPYRKVTCGVYCYGLIKEEDSNKNAQEVKAVEKCQVCALGNLFLSHIKIYDKVTLLDMGLDPNGDYLNSNRSSIINVLGKYFSQEQLDLIEYSFESCYEIKKFRNDGISKEDKAERFGQQYQHPRQRLRAICENILENNGTFKP